MRDLSHFYFKGIPLQEQPLITVAITCFNVEKYISRCIESVMAQSYQNLDILIVDDGSRDRTGTICDYYTTQDKRIRVVHQSNQGPGTARNHAIEMAEGEYVAFLDGDDYVESYIIEYMASAVIESECRLAVCRYFEDERDTGTDYHPLTENMRAGSVRILNNDDLMTGCVENSRELPISSMVWNKLYHRSLLEKRRFPNRMFYEDRLFTVQILHDAGEAVFIDTPLYHYIIDRKDSIKKQEGFFLIFSEWIPTCKAVREYLTFVGRQDLTYTLDYQVLTRLLDHYSEAKLDKLGDKSKYLEDITSEIEKYKYSLDEIFESRIADPKQRKRVLTFYEHRWIYDHFYVK